MRTHFFAGMALALSAAAAQEIPAPPKGGEIFPEWHAVGEAADRLMVPMGDTPRAQGSAAGYVRLPVNFAGTSHERVSWDIRVKADLRLAKGVQFDFFCPDLAPFGSFSLYFHSGEGWYHASFCPERVGVWQRIVVDKADTRVEGTGAGWGDVDLLRLSCWRGAAVNSACAIANLGPAGERPDVLVVRAESAIKKGGNEARSYGEYASAVSSTLDRLGIASVQVSDMDLAPELLEKVSLVVLPYNPSVPKEALERLRAFTERGGKLLVCYSLAAGVGELLGVRHAGGAEAEGGSFAGYARTDQGLKTQPAFAAQGSWRTTLVRAAEGQAARVIAVWRDGKGADTPHPAVTLTPAGAFFGHVWFNSAHDANTSLMRAVVGELVPEVWRKTAEQAFARIGAFGDSADFEAFRKAFAAASASREARRTFESAEKRRESAQALIKAGRWSESVAASGAAAEAAVRAWLMTQTPRQGEHRAFWCHSAFGLRDKTWDESIRLLKESGFNAILPNMLWGGLAYYPSEVLPAYEGVAEKGDQIALCLAACKKYGVKCHVWKVNWNTGGKAPKAFIARMAAEGRVQKQFSGEMQEEWLCPSHPANQDLEVESMLEIVRKYEVDGVHFDYIRYPGSDACFCDGCRARFEAKLGRAVSQWPKDTRKDGEVKAAWLDFRRANIDAVVRRVAEEARRIRPGVRVSAAVFRNWPVDRDGVGQDWKMWCDKGWLDFVCPMDYTDSNTLFRNMVAAQIGYAGRVPLYPGIGLSCWKDPHDAVKMAEQIRVVRELGVPGFTVFNYDANAEAVLPGLRLGVTAPRRSWLSRLWPF